MIIRPTWVEIDASALRHNWALLRQLAAPAQVLPVVKADAYGHGAALVTTVLASLGSEAPSWFAVVLVEEALALRALGVKQRILVMGGSYDGGWEEMLRHRLTPTLFRIDQLDAYAAAAAAQGLPAVAHVKIDTGLGRLGLQPAELRPFLERARAKGIQLEGLFSHLALGDGTPEEVSRRQWTQYVEAYRTMAVRGFNPTMRHLSKSGSLLSLPEGHDGRILNWVRPGLALYGLWPAPGLLERAPLRPAMRWVTRIAHLKSVPKGTPISYGGDWVASRDSTIATLPVGYADGYPRLLSSPPNRAHVLVGGQPAPIAGRVCMDFVMVDVTDHPKVGLNDEVVLMGEQGGQALPAEKLASWAGTINYEVVCGIGPRVPRIPVRARDEGGPPS